jgi:hypothetical protein
MVQLMDKQSSCSNKFREKVLKKKEDASIRLKRRLLKQRKQNSAKSLSSIRKAVVTKPLTQYVVTPIQIDHLATTKSKIYTNQMKQFE